MGVLNVCGVYVQLQVAMASYNWWVDLIKKNTASQFIMKRSLKCTGSWTISDASHYCLF